VKRLPTELQLSSVFASLDDVAGRAADVQARMSQAIAHERAHPSDRDGYNGGNAWTSSTEAAALANVDRRRSADPQRALLERAVERLVRGVADIVQAEHDLAALEAMQRPSRGAA
jgi:hypothetical protein